MTLTTLANVKSHLSLVNSNTTEDSRLNLFISSASSFIETYCGRIFNTASHVEFHTGRANNYILPNQYPVQSIEEVRLAETGVMDSTSYMIADFGNTIQFVSRLQAGVNNVKVSYTAGYSTIPGDLELACIWAVEWYYRHRQRVDIGKTSTSKGDESIGILAEVPKQILQMLDPYKRLELANAGVAVF